MRRIHIPVVDARYWVAITLSSIFGTNLGDLYAHESGLGIVRGLLVLVALAATVFAVERRDRTPREVYYWLAILIIRTGATNIADYLAFRVRVPGVALTIGLALLVTGFGWWSQHRSGRASSREGDAARLPDTGSAYWAAMLGAGVFGTVLGDQVSHAIGQGAASIVLAAALAVVLALRRGLSAKADDLYWLVVATARTAGTAIGDFIAENRTLQIGLPLSTLLTGAAFAAVLILWRHRPDASGTTGFEAARQSGW